MHSAPLSESLLMIPRELPEYLSTAYSLRFKEETECQSIVLRIFTVISRYIILIQELIFQRPSQDLFNHNIKRLDVDFEEIHARLSAGTKPICAYFVSNRDHNGSILSDALYYYHHYKIQKFQKHFDVAAKVVRSTKELFEHLAKLKFEYPHRQIQVVDIVAHGAPNIINIGIDDEFSLPYGLQPIRENEFSACADDTAIILDACSSGCGENSVAEEIARKNPGKSVMAPGLSLFFSKPVFVKDNGKTRVDNVVHGFAIFNAYTNKKFRFDPS